MILLGLLDASIQYTMLDSNLHYFNQPDLNGEFPLIHVMHACKNTKEKDYAGSGSNLISSSSTVVISTLILVA